jgi:hypothetical protein
MAYVAPTGRSGYGVIVGAVSPTMVDAVRAAAASPLPPISESAARQAAERALSQAEASTNSSIASNAALAGTLGSLLLGATDPAAG